MLSDSSGNVTCNYCGRKFLRSNRRVNENVKFGWKFYCSGLCQSKAKNFQILTKCSRLGCNRVFKRLRNQYNKSTSHYCSRSCAVAVNNSINPKRKAVIKKCQFCGKDFKTLEKFCSNKCRYNSQIITKEEIIDWINKFYAKNKRIPFKREYHHYHAARGRFGTWNNAIVIAGFKPNPVRFANIHIANDSHRCDSLAEKIIDDWLFNKGIKHLINYPYPGGYGLTADFKIDDTWIEFFGLSGENARYDKLKRLKRKLIKRWKLNLIDIYRKDLFPKNRLNYEFRYLVGN